MQNPDPKPTQPVDLSQAVIDLERTLQAVINDILRLCPTLAVGVSGQIKASLEQLGRSATQTVATQQELRRSIEQLRSQVDSMSPPAEVSRDGD